MYGTYAVESSARLCFIELTLPNLFLLLFQLTGFAVHVPAADGGRRSSDHTRLSKFYIW